MTNKDALNNTLLRFIHLLTRVALSTSFGLLKCFSITVQASSTCVVKIYLKTQINFGDFFFNLLKQASANTAYPNRKKLYQLFLLDWLFLTKPFFFRLILNYGFRKYFCLIFFILNADTI